MKTGRCVLGDGSIHYYDEQGRLHREDGPAVEYPNGQRNWYINGKRHRDDGPAIITPSGREYWFHEGKYISCSTLEEFQRIVNLKAFW